MHKKYSISIITIILVLLFCVVIISYAYFASHTSLSNIDTTVTVGENNIVFIASGIDNLNLLIDNSDLNETNIDQIAKTINSSLDISLLAGTTRLSTCTYDIVWNWETASSSNQYVKTTGADKEYTVAASSEEQSFNEIQVSDYDADNLSSVLYSGSISNSSLTIATEQTWDFNINFYNLSLEQERVFEGTYNSNITIENINCTENIYAPYQFSYAGSDTENFEYTGNNSIEWITPKNGVYTFELWGARGGGGYGYGGYTKGDIFLESGTKLYLFVGEYPSYTSGSCYSTNPNTSFNGNRTGTCASGGGATDIRLVDGQWDDLASLKSRIMVAGAGGGTIYGGTGGPAGGLISYEGNGTGGASNYYVGQSVNQTPGTTFGIPSKSTTSGGGGYYGGLGAYGGNSSGGSSYISGHTGCVAIESSSSTNAKTSCLTGTTDNSCSIHYSNYFFTNTKMIDGAGYSWTNEVSLTQEQMPNPSGGYYTLGQGNNTHGFVRITYQDKGYVKENNILLFDGIQNTTDGHSSNTLAWKDLSGNNNDGIITSGTWNNNNLLLTNSAVMTDLYAATTLPRDSDFTLSITTKINALPYTNTTYGNTGVLIGAAYYNGTGISWITPGDIKRVFGFLRTDGGSRSTTAYAFTLPFTATIDYVHSAALGKMFLYINGEYYAEANSITSGVYNYATQMGNIGINKAQISGGNYTTSYANMNVYSAKIYTKALTEEEILHNYKVDEARFKF